MKKNREKLTGYASVVIESLCLNHRGDSTIGGIHCRKNDTVGIPPEIKATGKIFSGTCVLVPPKLNSLELSVKLYNNGTMDFSGIIQAQEDHSNVVLGNIVSSAFTLKPGERTTQMIKINVSTLQWKQEPRIRKLKNYWKWSFVTEGASVPMIESQYIIYTILDIPQTPWEAPEEDYAPLKENYVWTDLLDVCYVAYEKNTGGASVHNAEQHINAYAKTLNENLAFTYDRKAGATKYLDSSRNFKLRKYLNDNADLGKKHDLNCTDCAHIVAIEGLASGIKCCVGRLGNIISTSWQGFQLNPIIGIGSTLWGAPFDSRSRAFSYHDITFMEDGTSTLSQNSLAYDACLKLDSGKYPGKEPGSGIDKIAFLPVQYSYSETEYATKKVNVPTDHEYVGTYYRERLVKHDTECNALVAYSIAGISQLTSSTQELTMEESGWISILENIKERFGLTTNPLTPFVVENVEERRDFFQRFTASAKCNWSLSEDNGRETIWLSNSNDQNVEVLIFDALDSNEAYSVLLEHLANISYPEIDRKDLGDIAYAVQDSLVVVVKKNFVFKISGENCTTFVDDLLKCV